MTLWIEVEDLFAYAAVHHRVSGIQRVSLELIRALGSTGVDGIRFVRQNWSSDGFITVPEAEVEALAASFGQSVPQGVAPPLKRHEPQSWMGRSWNRVTAWLPPRAEAEARRIIIARMIQARALRDRWMPRPAVLLPREEDGAELSRDAAVTLERVVKCGDTLLVLGAPWDRPDYAYQVARLRSRYGMRLAVMIHDLIPILHPEWCDAGIIRAFGGWNGSVLPLADQIFSNSRATARDVEEWAEREGVRIARPVVTLPLGTGFSGEAMAEGGDAAGLTPHVLALRQQPYVLFVSTIEARKNHLLAFRAWRQLLRDLPREQVPRLVFAGRVGWLVADLMQQLENANWLDGHVTLVRDPTDAELRGLYEGCWFTLFPSLYEGWGLPVTESLSFGKPCVASSRTAVPEAGGPYCLYHDPDSVTEAVALLKRVIAEPELIAERARRLRHEFRPTPWSAAAELILRTLGQPGQHSPNNARVDPVEVKAGAATGKASLHVVTATAGRNG